MPKFKKRHVYCKVCMSSFELFAFVVNVYPFISFVEHQAAKQNKHAGNEQKKLSLWQKVKEYPYEHFLYRAYKRYLLRATSYRIVSLEKELKKIPVINCLVIQKGKHSTYFKSEDTALVQSYQLDFLLDASRVLQMEPTFARLLYLPSFSNKQQAY